MNREAIEFFEALKQDEYAFSALDKEMFDVAIQALETWNNLFKSYEVLTKEITESGDIKNATKRIDDWCIEQLRGIIGDYYADLIIKER